MLDFYSALKQDDGWSDWSNWSPCSNTRDAGLQLRMRICSSPDMPEKYCPGLDHQVQSCVGQNDVCPRQLKDSSSKYKLLLV